ncbi:MAG: dihydrofolate reductase [Bacteroidota bacterium]
MMKIHISLIVAVSKNGVIGQNGKLPWRLSDDLKLFKQTTLNHYILMGRKTFESIGRPLPKRENLVISRQPDYSAPGIQVFPNLPAAFAQAEAAGEKEVFVIGGGEIYRLALPYSHRIYLTQVDTHIEGDTFFPELDPGIWQEQSRVHYAANDKNQYAFDFVVLEKHLKWIGDPQIAS